VETWALTGRCYEMANYGSLSSRGSVSSGILEYWNIGILELWKGGSVDLGIEGFWGLRD
jgi:hypothetical protein